MVRILTAHSVMVFTPKIASYHPPSRLRVVGLNFLLFHPIARAGALSDTSEAPKFQLGHYRQTRAPFSGQFLYSFFMSKRCCPNSEGLICGAECPNLFYECFRRPSLLSEA